MYSYKVIHTLYFFGTLILWSHFIVIFITMCNTINVNCFMKLIYGLIFNICICMQFNYLNATV